MPGLCILSALLVLTASGCGFLRKSALHAAAGTLTGEKALEVYSSDSDPELVREAFPFGLKTTELLIAEDPGNRVLYLTAAAGFTQYASAFLDEEADMLEETDFERSRELKKRAAALYFRGRRYALNGLELDHPRFCEELREAPAGALEKMTKKDVPFLFLAGAAWIGGISANPADMGRVAELSQAEAVMRRVLELDESYGEGAVHEFFIAFEGGRSEAMGGSETRAGEHYRRAIELTGGKKASPHVALASTVAVRRQDLELFRGLLEKALAVDVAAEKKWRLSNELSRKKARWLLGRLPDLFVDYEEDGESR